MTTNAITTQARRYSRESSTFWSSLKSRLLVVSHVTANLVNLVRAMAHVTIRVDENGTVAMMHESGTAVAMRADGNLDTVVQRNLRQSTAGILMLNCPPEDDKFTSFEQIKKAFPERYDGSMDPTRKGPKTKLLEITDWHEEPDGTIGGH